MRVDYTYLFNDITDQSSRVQVSNHRDNKVYHATIGVRDNQLSWWQLSQMPATVADLIDVGTAIYVADRLSLRRRDKSCNIKVVLPVRQVDVFKQVEIVEQLQHILFWFTGDKWFFEFTPRLRASRRSERQMILLNDVPRNPVEVCLWSGGLDSLAGLCKRLMDYPEQDFVLLGTGGSKYVRGVQQQVAGSLMAQFSGRIKLVQIPINLLNPENLRCSSSQRSRGFVFLILGAACAYLEGARTLKVYENGVGAINLPFRASEVGLDHARSVHPRSLYYMGKFISQLLEEPFSVENPFLYWTKAEMCRVFLEADLSSAVQLTISCDRRLRQKGQPAQCGCCSSCLLRRQALLANGIVDQTTYALDTTVSPMLGGLHLAAMLNQVNVIHSCLNMPNPSSRLLQHYPELRFDVIEVQVKQEGRSSGEIAKQLIKLYSSYAQEWEQVRRIMSEGLLSAEELQFLCEVPTAC